MPGDALDLHRAVPVGRGGDRAAIGAEADQGGVVAEALARELADIMLAADLAHLGELGIADMRIMRPDHGLGAGPAMLKQPLQRVEHVLVAQIPRHRVAVIHHPVILLGRRDDARILLGAEKCLAVPDRDSRDAS